MMRQFLKQYRVLLISLVLVLVGLHLVSSSIDDPKNAGFFGRMILTIYEPIYKTISYPFSKADSAMSNLTSITSMRAENAKLVEQNKALQMEVNRLSELALAAERYSAILDIKQANPNYVKAAKVIARPPSGEYRVLALDKGEKDGIQNKMTAITPKGLVGHVVQTMPYASKILLITDANSSVPAIVQRTRANAIVKGQSKSLLKLKFLQRNEDVAFGDVVVTSGLGGIFPKGLVIGKVAKVIKEDFGVYQNAEVEPVINLELVEEVVLVKNENPMVSDLMEEPE